MDASGNDIDGASAGRQRAYSGEPFDVERAYNSGEPLDVKLPETAHQISTDSWFQVGFLLTTGMSSAFVMGYTAAVMVPLGWAVGVVGFLAAAAISLYANALIAKLHEFGGKRHIRYRDLAGYVYGTRAYYLTWALQYVNLCMITIGFIILAGEALKAVYVLFNDDDTMKLPYFIAIAGFVCGIFAICIPHLSALRIWLVFSTFFSLVYIVVVLVLSIRDGIRAPPRNYSIPGTKISRIFRSIGAFSSIVTAYSAGMILEMQATIRAPAVQNMMKALYFQFTVGSLPFYAVVIVGYWAYGNGASYYLLNNVSGPVWVKAFANICAFLQSVISLHIFASPMYEFMDTKYGGKGGVLAISNISFRIMARGSYLTFTTLVAAMLPFIGDFISLTGAISIFPLTFILASHMYLVAKRSKLTSIQINWLWANVFFFSIVAVAATVAALRLIAVDSKTYSLFADL